MAARQHFGKLTEIIEPPNLIEIQTASYRDFLQWDTPPNKRKRVGLQAVFRETFPVESYDGRFVLDFVQYEFHAPPMDAVTCLREGQTYAAPLYVTFDLKEGSETRRETVFLGDIPLMTETGSFVINGSERVIVSQLHRSPGICFEQDKHANGTMIYSFRIIPDRGSWVEVQFDTSDHLWMYLDRRHRRRKFLVTTFLRAIESLDEEKAEKGEKSLTGTDAEILAHFYQFRDVATDARRLSESDLANLVFKEETQQHHGQKNDHRGLDQLGTRRPCRFDHLGSDFRAERHDRAHPLLDLVLHDAPCTAIGRSGGNRTPNHRFWRPVLCQLSY